MADAPFVAWRHARDHGALIDLAGGAEADQREFGDDLRVAAQHFLDHSQARVGVIDGGTERRAQIDEETTFILLRREGLADIGEEEGARSHGQYRQENYFPAMGQGAGEKTAVEGVEALKAAFDGGEETAVLVTFFAHCQKARTEHRRQRQ